MIPEGWFNGGKFNYDTVSKEDPLSQCQINLYNKNFEFAEFEIDFEQQFIINDDTKRWW